MLREVRAAIGPERGCGSMPIWRGGWRLRCNRCPTRDVGVESLEEPVAGLAAMAELRRSTPIPLSAHSSDIPTAAAPVAGADALVLGIAGCGGIGATLRFAAACAAAGVGFRFYSGDLGIATAAELHVALRWSRSGARTRRCFAGIPTT